MHCATFTKPNANPNAMVGVSTGPRIVTSWRPHRHLAGRVQHHDSLLATDGISPRHIGTACRDRAAHPTSDGRLLQGGRLRGCEAEGDSAGLIRATDGTRGALGAVDIARFVAS